MGQDVLSLDPAQERVLELIRTQPPPLTKRSSYQNAGARAQVNWDYLWQKTHWTERTLRLLVAAARTINGCDNLKELLERYEVHRVRSKQG